jgi:hypothetical protein
MANGGERVFLAQNGRGNREEMRSARELAHA